MDQFKRKSILLAGATGLVGRHCLQLLLADPAFERVVVLTRRPLPPGFPAAAKLEQHVVDFSRLDYHAALFDVDQVLCALGTTIKTAGSEERFREVDYRYPLQLARAALAGGARHFLAVSALGADARSRVFYNRVKGELENDLLALPYRSITIVRPSLLLGARDEFRMAEEIGKRLAFLIPARYKPVQAADVAAVLVDEARSDRPGHRILESAEIRSRARG